MRQYKGAVFFVDLLGIGALTQNKIELTDLDFNAFNFNGKERSAQMFCAKLLITFRSVLTKAKKKVRGINIAQLSDCAFIWSDDILSVLDAARNIMFEATRSGILLRGGLAFGEIVEPDKVNRSLGHFILGEASTKAVKMESSGKGCRIFSDIELPSELSTIKPELQHLFSPLKSPIDGAIVDEFRWYLPEDYIYLKFKSNKQKRVAAYKLMELISLLKYSELYNWNASSKVGAIQLALGIECISSATKDILQTDEFCFTVEYLIDNLGNRKIGKHQKILESYINEVNGLLPLVRQQSQREEFHAQK